MFLINDSLDERQAKIRSFLIDEPAIAVLLAAADFEWTTRRAILALGRSPTKDINARFRQEKKGGLSALKQYWKEEVKPRLNTDLATVVPDWMFLSGSAYDLRHKLVHGAQGTAGVGYASKVVGAFLVASEAISRFAEVNDEPIYGRRIRRIKAR